MARRTTSKPKPAKPEAVPIDKQRVFDELGTTGLKRSGEYGSVFEEFLQDLSGSRGMRIYREMRDNDPVVGAVMFVIEMVIRNVEWHVRGGDDDTAEFVEQCAHDMSHSFSDFISEVLSMLTYGYSWHEIIYKRRGGDVNDPTRRSRYNDGRIGWRKIPIRSQDSWNQWIWDEEGGIQAFEQVAPPSYRTVEIPINRSLLFRVGVHKGNPEGRSLIRNAYRPWYFKRQIEVIEGIGVERDLAGLPVIYRDGVAASKYDSDFDKILRNVRRNEQEGVKMPLVYDDAGNQMVKFELLASAGNRQLDISAIIERYSRMIAMTVASDFVLLGHENVGSLALADSKTGMFALAIGSILRSIADVLNQHAIPRLLRLNGIQADEMPRFEFGDIETPNLKELGSYITALAGAGAPLFPDEELEEYLRRAAKLPQKSEDAKTLAMPKDPASISTPKPSASEPMSDDDAAETMEDE